MTINPEPIIEIDGKIQTRLGIVQMAITPLLESLKNNHPNCKVGLITFNNEVCIIGDGMLDDPKYIKEAELFNFDII